MTARNDRTISPSVVRIFQNYDERYEGLGRLFHRRDFFEDFAREHNLSISFPPLEMANYWNTPFIFNCFMYRE